MVFVFYFLVFLDGESERKIGLALDKWYKNGGSRSDFILCTKTGTRDRPYNYSAEATKRSIYQSIKSLKTEYLDIVHIHDPENLSDALKSNGALSALQELKKRVLMQFGLVTQCTVTQLNLILVIKLGL